MAQSELTVTPPNPTPPTNMSFVGATGPNPPNYTKVNYAEMYGDLDANGNFTGTSLTPGDRKNPNPPPYADDGAAGAVGVFAAASSAPASGTGATSGGTENTYPGTDTAPFDTPNCVGPVPASSTFTPEGAGTEVAVTNPGNITHTYPGAVTMDTSKSYSSGPAATAASRAAGPNASHPSWDGATPAAAPTITGLLPVAPVSSATPTTTTLTVNGTNFKNGAVVNIGGVPYTTTFVSATQLKVMNIAPVRTSAGNTPITVRVGATTTAATNWVFT